MAPWADRVQSYTYINDGDFSSIFVPTVESTRLSYLLDNLVANKHYVMFVGAAGSGKTALMRDKLAELDPEAWSSFTINMHSFLDAPALQIIIEQPLEKKSGVRFGPPGSRRLIYLVDDMNMPYVDKYDTQSPIELLRQFVDYRGWYDKAKIVLKEVLNSQLLACMNPTAGSFTITPRMQRHFATFAVQVPGADIVRSIYGAIIEGHMGFGFDPEVAALAPKLANATVELHRLVANSFLPSATKFQYLFNCASCPTSRRDSAACFPSTTPTLSTSCACGCTSASASSSTACCRATSRPSRSCGRPARRSTSRTRTRRPSRPDRCSTRRS